MPHPLINKIRQLANISGNKIGDFFLITKTQRARCTAGAHKRPYDQILASKTSPKVPTSPSRNTHFLIKKLHHWITNGLLPNQTINYWKLIHKTATTIGDHFGAFLKLSLHKMKSLHLDRCLKKRFQRKFCKIVLYTEEVTIW